MTGERMICRKALVLAGGSSRRMGRDKATLEIDGRTQLERAVTKLRRHVDEVLVSSRREQAADPLRARYPQLFDAYDDLGPLAGILTALESAPDDPWLVLACDLPRVDDETIEYLLANIDGNSIATAYRSSFDGLPEPLCAVWMPRAVDPVRAAIAEGTTCPRKILIRAEATLLSQPVAGALDNVNTPADLERVIGTAS